MSDAVEMVAPFAQERREQSVAPVERNGGKGIFRADGVHEQPKAHQHIGGVAEFEARISEEQRGEYDEQRRGFRPPNGTVGGGDAGPQRQGDENEGEDKGDEVFLHDVMKCVECVAGCFLSVNQKPLAQAKASQGI